MPKYYFSFYCQIIALALIIVLAFDDTCCFSNQILGILLKFVQTFFSNLAVVKIRLASVKGRLFLHWGDKS